MAGDDSHVQVTPGTVPEGLTSFATQAQAHFFQSPAWLRLIAAVEPRYEPYVATVSDTAGALVAALPLFRVRSWGTRRLFGGPWGTYSGIISRSDAATRVLRQWLQAQAAQVSLVRIHDYAGSIAAIQGGWRSTPESCQVLPLTHDAQPLFDAFTSQNRNKIRKAEKNDVQVTCHGADADALATYADLYAQLAERLGVKRPFPPALFAGLAQCDGVEVWLARHAGGAVAGLLNFSWGGQIMNWGNVSLPDSWSLAPNNLLHWRALQQACLDADGPRLYNFGSSAVSDSVHQFKKSFGAVERAYARHERSAAWLRWLARLRGRRT